VFVDVKKYKIIFQELKNKHNQLETFKKLDILWWINKQLTFV